MTSAISHSDRHRAFSLVELLVVIGIITVLAGIGAPMLIKAYAQSEKNKNIMDLRTIALALEAYKQDFGDIPRLNQWSAGTDKGATLLCHALVGPNGVERDGHNGNGFKLRKLVGADLTIDTIDDVGQGKVWGPYIQLERVKIVGTAPNQTLGTKDSKTILYYPASSANPRIDKPPGTPTASPDPTGGFYGGYVSAAPAVGRPDPLIRSDDNSLISVNVLRVMLGDYGYNGAIDTQLSGCEESQVFKLPFLLIAPGADSTYGPAGTNTSGGITAAKWQQNKNAAAVCDDITNIPPQ